MATYVISDIHGALEEFRQMLLKIDFKYDGTDALYLLGDYVDWGECPIGALKAVKELDEKYSFVHCLIGNHEWMFLQTIDAEARGARGMDGAETNWFFNNRGLATWNEFMRLPKEEQESIAVWMRKLAYSASCEVNGRLYLMSHAYPYFDDIDYFEEECGRRKIDAVWRRLMIREDPFGAYEGKRPYDCFICGHTITEFYYYKLRFEHDWPNRKPDPSVRNRIFFWEKFIDIDCGAKCLNCKDDPLPSLRRGAMRGQLSCLRLDDMHEFYQHPVKHRTPKPESAARQPTLTWPQIDTESGDTMPGLRSSGIPIPDIDLTDLHLPEIRLPGKKKNKEAFHQMTLEDLMGSLFRTDESASETGSEEDNSEAADSVDHEEETM